MKKSIVIIFFLLVFTGCTAEYQVDISKDGVTTENVVGLRENSYFENVYISTEKMWETMIAYQKKLLLENQYEINKISTKLEKGYTVSKKYGNIKEYIDKSILWNQFFEVINYSDENGIIIIETDKFIPNNPDSVSRYYINETKIVVSSKYRVIETNADVFDRMNNVLTWNISSETQEKKIYIKFDTEKVIQTPKSMLTITLLFIFAIITFVIIIYYIRKFKIKNTI